MERIGNPQVLLLEDHQSDGRWVSEVLTLLEEGRMIRVLRKAGDALGFFADSTETPLGIVIFMNSKSSYGLLAGDLYRMTHLPNSFLSKEFSSTSGAQKLLDFVRVLAPEMGRGCYIDN